MPPRLRSPARCIRLSVASRPATPFSASAVFLSPTSTATPPASRHYATASALAALRLPDDYVPPTQPPSARPPEARKSQLLRTYTSLLRSTPLILIFQHNNLTALEWAALRRELRAALAKVAPGPAPPAPSLDPAAAVPVDISSAIQIQVIRTRIFSIALKVVEFFDPAAAVTSVGSSKAKKIYTHDLSRAAYDAVETATRDVGSLSESSTYAQLSAAMVGPLALLTLPAVSPAHLSAVLSILAPNPPAFPPPTRKKSPGYYDPHVQSALQKLLLIGGRIEGKVFDLDGVRWVGGIEGGIDGLRAQLVAMLQSAGLGLTTTLEGAGKSLWLTMESRRSVLEDESKGGEAESAKQES